jgi:hypothetical protein
MAINVPTFPIPRPSNIYQNLDLSCEKITSNPDNNRIKVFLNSYVIVSTFAVKRPVPFFVSFRSITYVHTR